jgi:hypothetical protein
LVMFGVDVIPLDVASCSANFLYHKATTLSLLEPFKKDVTIYRPVHIIAVSTFLIESSNKIHMQGWKPTHSRAQVVCLSTAHLMENVWPMTKPFVSHETLDSLLDTFSDYIFGRVILFLSSWFIF